MYYHAMKFGPYLLELPKDCTLLQNDAQNLIFCCRPTIPRIFTQSQNRAKRRTLHMNL